MAFFCNICKELIELTNRDKFFKLSCCDDLTCSKCFYSKINIRGNSFVCKFGTYKPNITKCPIHNTEIEYVEFFNFEHVFCFGCVTCYDVVRKCACNICGLKSWLCKNRDHYCIRCSNKNYCSICREKSITLTCNVCDKNLCHACFLPEEHTHQNLWYPFAFTDNFFDQ